MTRDPDHLLPSAEPVQLIDHRGRRRGRRGRRTPCPRRRRCSARSPRWSPAAGSTTRPTRWCGRAGSPSTRPRTARRPARSRPRRCSREGDWLFPTYRDTVAAVAPRRRPGRGADAAQGRLALGLRPLRAPRRAAGHAAGHPAAARGRRRARGPAQGRGHRGDGDVRRRRDQRGRLPRGAELRRGLQRAGRLLRAEQRVRDLACRWPASPSRRRWRTRASGTASRASGSTATTRPRCWPSSGTAVDAGPRRRGPAARRGAHLPDAGPHQRRRRDPLPAGRRGRRLGRARPDHPARGLPARARPAGRRAARGVRGRRRARSRRTCATG